ncbi:hypothetical protein ACPA9J_04455 [Pseudomonas aeruginosa]
MVYDESELIKSAKRYTEAGAAFGNPMVYLEKFLTNPRHVSPGAFRRPRQRHPPRRPRLLPAAPPQKVIEEAPAWHRPVRKSSPAASRPASGGCRGAGTFEFLYRTARYFIEMNTRVRWSTRY